MAAEADAPEPVPGLTHPRAVSLERFAIRARESATTLAAWRLSVESDEGTGSIVLVDAVGGGPFHRGDGVFLGWPQDRMAEAYRALRPACDDGGFETQQLG